MNQRVAIPWVVLLLVGAMSLVGCGGDDDSTDDNAGDGNSDDDDNADDDDTTSDDDDNDDDDNDDDDEPTNPFLNPNEPGPYLVGNTTFFFEDAARPLSCGDGNRILMTEFWYPAADGSDALPENHITDFFLGRIDEVEQALRDAGIDPEGEITDLPTGSYRDAPLHPDAPDMPILLFSHGFFSNRFQNYTMAAYLASHGYLVVAPDHICNSQVTLTPDAVVIGNPLSFFTTLPERTDDLVFLLDSLLDDPPAQFAGRIDANAVGLWGHSFGGLTVTELFKIERRADAMVQLASFGFPDVPDDIDPPSMYLYGFQDKVMHPYKRWHDQVVERMPTPKYELNFFDTGHFAFSDLCEFQMSLAENGNGCGTETRIGSEETFTNPDHALLHAVLNPYTTAFFGAALYGYSELAEYLEKNHFPAMMQYLPDVGGGF